MAPSIRFTAEELRRYAASVGLSMQLVVKEAFLFELAELLEGNDFILKGGTAINKVYLPGHQRFSEDLDYDTDKSKAKVREIIIGLGWNVKQEYFMRHSVGFLLNYEFEGVKDVVKVDFAFSINGAYERKQMVSDFLPISKLVNVYMLRELNLQKEYAFEDRIEWKDIYDLYWMNKLYPNEFKIHDKEKFRAALDRLSVPKTANSFIPVQKRTNWTQVIETMRSLSE
ncbi:MAG: nucleotidyl transferase AbiEii/AbiGii toxin family protein [Candidatus Micrarchaeaceae archaeon]